MFSHNEPMIVEQQDADEQLTVELKDASEAGNEEVINRINEYVEEAGEDGENSSTPVPQLETLRNKFERSDEASASTLEVIDALRALPDVAIEIDRSEDHTPNEYVWFNGFRFVGIQSGGEPIFEKQLQDYGFPRLVHFTSVYPVTFLPLSETPFEV